MYLCRRYTSFSLKELGEIFNKDHTTIIHGIKRVENVLLDKEKQP